MTKVTWLLGVALGAACASAPPPAPAPVLSPDARCAAASEKARSELGRAAEGCLSDAGCVAFDSCHAVLRAGTGALVKARAEMSAACAVAPARPTEVECVPRPLRCVAGRCVRF